MEAPWAEADPAPGRRWNTWEIAPIHGVDTAGIGLLRVRVWRFRRPRIPGAGSCRTPLRCVSQPTLWGHASRVPGRGWRGAPPLRSRRTPALRCGVRARPSCEPCPVAPDGAWPRRLRSRSMARAGAVHVRLRAIVGRRDLVGGVRAAAMTVRWSSGSAPATRFATAAPTARCPGSGAGSWGFKGGATSPWPYRNVSHCVAWLRRIRSSPGTDAWNRRMTARLARGRGGQPRRLRSR